MLFWGQIRESLLFSSPGSDLSAFHVSASMENSRFPLVEKRENITTIRHSREEKESEREREKGEFEFLLSLSKQLRHGKSWTREVSLRPPRLSVGDIGANLTNSIIPREFRTTDARELGEGLGLSGR